jgi:hypothetical protein
MRAVKVRCGVVRLLYVRHKSHAIGEPIALFFSRHSAVQFGAETLVAADTFFRVAADTVAAPFSALSTRFVRKFNDKRAVPSQAFADTAKVRLA